MAVAAAGGEGERRLRGLQGRVFAKCPCRQFISPTNTPPQLDVSSVIRSISTVFSSVSAGDKYARRMGRPLLFKVIEGDRGLKEEAPPS